MTGRGERGRDLLAGGTGPFRSGVFQATPRRTPPGVAALQRCHVENPVDPVDQRFPGAVFPVTQRGSQEALVAIGVVPVFLPRHTDGAVSGAVESRVTLAAGTARHPRLPVPALHAISRRSWGNRDGRRHPPDSRVRVSEVRFADSAGDPDPRTAHGSRLDR